MPCDARKSLTTARQTFYGNTTDILQRGTYALRRAHGTSAGAPANTIRGKTEADMKQLRFHVKLQHTKSLYINKLRIMNKDEKQQITERLKSIVDRKSVV